MGSMTILPPNAVTLKDGHAVTTSLKVAEIFGKQHKHVLEAINNLDCPEEFGRTNFRPSSYFNAQNKVQPMYEIAKDGFTFLVMGYTGPKAAQFKVAYINQFNEMEAALRQPLEPPRETVTMDKLEAENLKLRLENAEMKLTMLTGKPIPKRRAWKQDELSRMITLTRQGLKAIEIGEKLGRSHDSVETKQRELKQKGML